MNPATPRPGGDRQAPRKAPGNTREASTVQADLDRWQVRRLAVRVLLVQVFALTGLWLLQSWFGRP